MFRKHCIYILIVILLASCSPDSTADVSTENVDSIATSVALTLEAWVPEEPEMDTPIPEPTEAIVSTSMMGDLNILTTDYENALPTEAQLLIGTLKLNELGLDISSEQAEQLLPLWNGVRDLISAETSDDLTQIETQLADISELMTEEQITAIAALQLTQEDLDSTMQELGLEMGGMGGGQGGRPGGETEAGAQPPPQDGDESGNPGRGNGAGAGQGTGTETGTRPGGDDMTTGSMPGLNPVLLDTLIEFLEAQTQ